MSLERTVQRTSKFLLLEFSDLDELLKDVQKQELLLQQVQDKKNIQALTKYYTKRIKKEERYAERIERRLNRWIKRLDKLLLVVELNIANDVKEQLETIRAHIDICNNTIIRILAKEGELHKLIKQEQVSWKEVEAKIKEALGDNNHPGVRSLIIIIEQLQQLETKQEDAVKLSKDIAKSKLAKIMDNFEDYAIRFMNLGEYQQIVEERKLDGGEVYVVKWESDSSRKWREEGRGQDISFKNYISPSSSSNYITVATHQTSWDVSVTNMESYRNLQRKLDYLFDKLKESNETNRKKILKEIRESILRSIKTPQFYILSEVKYLLEKNKNIEPLIEQYGRRRVEIAKTFLTSEQWLLNDKSNLKKLMDMLSFARLNPNEDSKQYHLALVIHTDTLRTTRQGFDYTQVHPWCNSEWGYINNKTPNPESKVLAVIVVIPNKKLLSTVIAESSHAQEWAHPVFDWKGKVRWP